MTTFVVVSSEINRKVPLGLRFADTPRDDDLS